MGKKRIILLAVIVIAIAIPTILFLSGNKEKVIDTAIKPNSVKKVPAVQTTPRPTPDLSKVDVYSEKDYTLYSPKGWSNTKSEMTNKTGTVFLLQPQASSWLSNPHITVEVVDAKLNSVKNMTAEFSIFGYKQITETLPGGIKATKYQRSIESSQGTLHSTAYIYQKNDKIYFFKLGYTQVAEDPQLEEQLKQVVTDFSINQG